MSMAAVLSKSYSGEDTFVETNKHWMEKLLPDAGFWQWPGAVHVAFVTGNWELLLGYEKNKQAWDFFGGKVDAYLTRMGVSPAEAALRCLYRDAFVEELGVLPQDLNIEHMVFGYKRINNSLLLVVRTSRTFHLDRIKVNMRTKLSERLPTCFQEMSDIRLVNLYHFNSVLLGQCTGYVQQEVDWIRDTYRGLRFDDLVIYNFAGFIKDPANSWFK